VSFNYAPLQSTATQLLTDFGQTATHVATTRDGVTLSTTGVAVQIQITEGERNRAAINGTELPARKYIVSAAITPVKGARLTVGTETGVVMQVDPIQPGSTALGHYVGVRAG
jgi:hypothetical protein